MQFVNGQIFVRETGEKRNGKRLVMAVAILAVPDDFLEGETQYQLSGAVEEGVAQLTLSTYPARTVKHGKRFLGSGIGHILTEPIWSV